MAGRDLAIRSDGLPLEMAGSSPAMTGDCACYDFIILTMVIRKNSTLNANRTTSIAQLRIRRRRTSSGSSATSDSPRQPIDGERSE